MRKHCQKNANITYNWHISITENLKETENELNLSRGLVQILQSDVSAKEHRIIKLNTALTKMTTAFEEANAEVKALSHKFANLKEEKKHEEIMSMMERELRDVSERHVNEVLVELAV